MNEKKAIFQIQYENVVRISEPLAGKTDIWLLLQRDLRQRHFPTSSAVALKHSKAQNSHGPQEKVNK